MTFYYGFEHKEKEYDVEPHYYLTDNPCNGEVIVPVNLLLDCYFCIQNMSACYVRDDKNLFDYNDLLKSLEKHIPRKEKNIE